MPHPRSRPPRTPLRPWSSRLVYLPALLLTLFLTTPPSMAVQAQAAAKGAPLPAGTVLNTTPVPVSQCQFPFRFNNELVYGCTTAGDTKAWCVVQPSADRGPQDWRYCDLATVSAALAGIVPNDKCAAGWQSGGATVHGCIKADADPGFACKADASAAAVPCKVDATRVSAKAVAAGQTSGDAVKVGASVPVGAIIGGVAGLVAVALIVGILVARRRAARKKATAWNDKHATGYNGTGLDLGPNHGPTDFRFAAPAPPAPPAAAVERCYPVISTYTPTLGDELEIQPGDKVQLVIEYDDGWCQGINLSRGGAKGVFPKHCIDMSAAY